MSAIVYQYGTRSNVPWPAEADQQLRLAHELRNHLVELHKTAQDEIAAVWAAHPDVAITEEAVIAAQAEVDRLREQATAEHVADRSRETRAQTRQAVAEARKRLREARAARKAAKEIAYPAAKPALQAVRDRERAGVKAAYADFVQTRGLYWATYNDVVDHHRTAQKRIAAQRKQGKPADLRFHRWTGEGTIAVQLQRQAGMAARTPELLASGEGPWRNVFQLSPWIDPQAWEAMTRAERRKTGRGVARLRLGTDATLELPVIVHRMLPADADVAMARVTRRRVAGQWRTTLTVTAKLPDPALRTEGEAVSAHLGWRALPDGTLRVATFGGKLPRLPADLPLRLGRHGTAELFIPRDWRDLHQRIASVRSRRDRNLDLLRDALVSWLDANAAQDVHGDPLDAAVVKRWRSPGRFAALAMHWRDNPPANGAKIAAELEAWRKQDRHLWEWEAHERDQLIARRDDTYRKTAAWLLDQPMTLVLDTTDLTTLRRTPAPEDDDDRQAERARANATLAAPGRLRELLVSAAGMRGVTVQTHGEAYVTTHRRCGTVLERTAEWADKPAVHCPTCGLDFDQDHNAAVLLADRASGPVAA